MKNVTSKIDKSKCIDRYKKKLIKLKLFLFSNY